MKKLLYFIICLTSVGIIFGFISACSTKSNKSTPTSGWSYIGNEITTTNIGSMKIALNSNNLPVVAYIDTSTNKAKVVNLSGASWVTIGSSFGSGTAVSDLDLAVDGNNIYVALFTSTSEVWKWDGTAWSQLTTNAPTSTVHSLAVYNSTPYISTVLDDGYGNRNANVYKYTSDAWTSVGDANFKNGANYTTVQVASDGTTYCLVTTAGTNTFGFELYKLVNSTWSKVNNFSIYNAGDYSFKVTGTNVYLAYNEYEADSKVHMYLKMFNGTTWDSLPANSVIEDEQYIYANLFVEDTTPYIAYKDIKSVPHVGKVKKYDGTEWSLLGSEPFTGYDPSDIALVVRNGAVFIAYGEYNETDSTNKLMVRKFTP